MGSHSPSSRKSKKHKKQKHKRHKEHKSRKNRGDSSDSDASPDVNTQLFKSRAVAQATREILAYKYELKSELRELIRQLDAGEALAIDGVEDSYLKSRLDTLFTNLSQVRKTSAGQYYKRSKEGDAIIGFLAPLLAESAGQVAAYAPQGPPVSAVSRVDDPTASRLVEGAASFPNSAVPPPPEAPVARPTSPSAPPGPASVEEDEEDAGRPPHHDSTQGPRRVLGPAAPPPEFLAAAALLPLPPSPEPGALGADDDDEDAFLVGPVPPDLAGELDLASSDDRSAEVARILGLAREREARLAGVAAADAARDPLDPYEVLGLGPEATPAEVKRRYMRTSLLIHPDKCDHPGAADAFQAVARAAKELQDLGLRAAVDARREEAALRREFEAEQAVAERQRAWRIARGEATPADLAGPAPGGAGPAREAWMTELPPERSASATVAAVAPGSTHRGFSQSGIKPRGDTSGWTLTPQQRALQLEGGGAAGGGTLLGPAPGGGAAAVTASAVDAYNAATRKRSLVEQHAERLAAATKKKGKKKTRDGAPAPAQAPADWDPATQPWRPFDREKDLVGGRGDVQSAQQRIAALPALSSRFGGAGGGRGASSGARTFL
ncbi:Protein CAJ1 [Auxenochlorella protothecoides]|uniref:Protein CAJ1 n=1 Tax=Auxenochlorella protothecoides TaxID=3075 RepID=A0A087SK96_AUXPR|nr:Protein CAJ1 [Auxenochlorella protothecoides]KFM26150.1 Protein CAJ1 [Auxenochlorella protothecoides]